MGGVVAKEFSGQRVAERASFEETPWSAAEHRRKEANHTWCLGLFVNP
jgi:hypothetical protein